MKKVNNVFTLFLLFITVSFVVNSCSTNKLTYNIQDQSQCETKDGYWYNNKCWKGFEDEGIPNSKIDSTVAAQMKLIDKSTFIMDNQTYPLVVFMPVEEEEGMLFLAVYGTHDNYNSLIFLTGKKNIKNGTFQSPVVYFKGDAMAGEIDENSLLEGTATITVVDLDNLKIEIKGKIENKDATSSKNFSFTSNEAITGAGNSHIEIKGNEAYLSGDLGTITYAQIKDLIKNHPEVKTIVMTHISGSVNDAVNMHTGRLLHENGFTTKVLAHSDIASGGVDLFCAGVERIVIKGAKLGIHSWCCIDDTTAAELPKDHPAHQYQLEYFNMCLGEELGSDFYFRTLTAAPADDIYYMKDDEIKKWKVATKFITPKNAIDTEYIKETIDKSSEKTNNTGVLFLEKNNEDEFVYATGNANKETSKKITKTDLFEIGSASKLFTSVAIFQLIEQGKISLDTPISTFYPKGSNVYNLGKIKNKNHFDKVTIGMLLNHTSGFIDYLNIYGDDEKALQIFSNPNITYSFNDIIELAVKHGDAHFIPGKKFEYCNTGYIILGDIISKVSNQDWHDYIQQHIFDKIGMKNTYFSSIMPKSVKKTMVNGYYNNQETNMPASLAGSAGEIISSLHDLETFLIAWQDGKLITKTTLKIQQQKGGHIMYDEIDFINYNYGVMNVNGFYGHAGQTFGFQSYIGINPKTNKIYVIGANNASFDVFSLFLTIENLPK